MQATRYVDAEPTEEDAGGSPLLSRPPSHPALGLHYPPRFPVSGSAAAASAAARVDPKPPHVTAAPGLYDTRPYELEIWYHMAALYEFFGAALYPTGFQTTSAAIPYDVFNMARPPQGEMLERLIANGRRWVSRWVDGRVADRMEDVRRFMLDDGALRKFCHYDGGETFRSVHRMFSAVTLCLFMPVEDGIYQWADRLYEFFMRDKTEDGRLTVSLEGFVFSPRLTGFPLQYDPEGAVVDDVAETLPPTASASASAASASAAADDERRRLHEDITAALRREGLPIRPKKKKKPSPPAKRSRPTEPAPAPSRPRAASLTGTVPKVTLSKMVQAASECDPYGIEQLPISYATQERLVYLPHMRNYGSLHPGHAAPTTHLAFFTPLSPHGMHARYGDMQPCYVVDSHTLSHDHRVNALTAMLRSPPDVQRVAAEAFGGQLGNMHCWTEEEPGVAKAAGRRDSIVCRVEESALVNALANTEISRPGHLSPGINVDYHLGAATMFRGGAVRAAVDVLTSPVCSNPNARLQKMDLASGSVVAWPANLVFGWNDMTSTHTGAVQLGKLFSYATSYQPAEERIHPQEYMWRYCWNFERWEDVLSVPVPRFPVAAVASRALGPLGEAIGGGGGRGGGRRTGGPAASAAEVEVTSAAAKVSRQQLITPGFMEVSRAVYHEQVGQAQRVRAAGERVRMEAEDRLAEHVRREERERERERERQRNRAGGDAAGAGAGAGSRGSRPRKRCSGIGAGVGGAEELATLSRPEQPTKGGNRGGGAYRGVKKRSLPPKISDAMQADPLLRMASDVTHHTAQPVHTSINRALAVFSIYLPETRRFFSLPHQLARALVFRFPQHYPPETTDLTALAQRILEQKMRFDGPPEAVRMLRRLWVMFMPVR
jgi:hypothetical protein